MSETPELLPCDTEERTEHPRSVQVTVPAVQLSEDVLCCQGCLITLDTSTVNENHSSSSTMLNGDEMGIK
jgi:hypothetical protein